MTYLVVVDNVVQGLFGPTITAEPSAGLLFPREAHRFTSQQEAAWRASELPGSTVVPLAGERVA